ncbi:MAG: alpha,alpha-trehalose-phosphate synthase (UDP-forming) [Actinomycetota bacterium]
MVASVHRDRPSRPGERLTASAELTVCSHRGPFVYERSGAQLEPSRGGGGLIGAVAPVLAAHGGTWITAAMSDGDRELAREHPQGRDEGGFVVRMLDLPKDAHTSHYDVVSNEYLWFLFHYLFDVPSTPVFDASFDEAWADYRHVNELYADAVLTSGRSDAVLVQDYHLMLVGALLRKKGRVRRPLLYFHHTPWCDPEYFSLLPENTARELLEAMLAYDVIGFHARRWADAFAACCARFLPRSKVTSDAVTWGKRSVRIVVAPVPLDVQHLKTEAADPRTQEWVARHEELSAGRSILLRVDRIDLSKNPLRGFLAFEELLQRRPELAREIIFLALLYPSRLNVETYRRYYTECLGVVRRVNERFEPKLRGRAGPIELSFEDQYHRSLGAMRCYDALLVNPVFDGLNLVAKEGAFVNERSGALILSRNAGVFEELGGSAIAINPFDLSATAAAIERAVEMPGGERERMARALRRKATRSSPSRWVRTQLSAAGL